MMKYPGIYIHVPFCLKKCSYCDFYSVTGKNELYNLFIQSLLQEIKEKAPVHAGPIYDTVYIGGGTPNLLSCDHLSSIISQIRNSFTLHENSEITLEINPDFVTDQTLKHYKMLGINRLSLGCQSFIDEELQFLSRIHNSVKNFEALERIRKHDFGNLSCDLIVGLPGQPIKSIEYNLEQVLRFRPEHLSVYTLSIEKNTPMHYEAESGHISNPDPDHVRDIYLTVHKCLTNAGYLHYEVSNYCLPGFESRHNTKYWNDSDYLGFGPSAHSKSGRIRSWNGKNLQSYIMGNRLIEQEVLNNKEWLDEKIMLGLRTSQGLDGKELEPTLQLEDIQTLLTEINREGGGLLVSLDHSMIKVWPEGWVILDTIIEKISEKL